MSVYHPSTWARDCETGGTAGRCSARGSTSRAPVPGRRAPRKFARIECESTHTAFPGKLYQGGNVWGVIQMDLDVDLNKHLQRIWETIDELMPLSRACAAPAPESIQFLGTIVDNTIAFLTAPANAIDGGGRQIRFDQKRNWLSLMQAVHRSFFSSIHTATEVGLAQICRLHQIEVTASSRLKAENIIQRLRERISERDAKDIMSLAGKSPQFADYLNAALRQASFEESDAVVWRKYFRALSIVRNKVSHSDTTLSEPEVSDLQAGGFSVVVVNGQLVVNPRMYRQVVEHIMRFFTSVLSKLGGDGKR